MRTVSLPKQRAEVLVSSFVRSVYNWMCIGLALTGFIAYYVSTNEPILKFVYGNQIVFFGIIIAELALVFSISGLINKLSSAAATFLFVLYSALNGVTLSFIFLVYAQASIVSTFFICSGTFLACSIYRLDHKTRSDVVGRFSFYGSHRHSHSFRR